MRLNEINFSFGGLHCLRDFGCIYVEKNGHAITPDITRNEYEIAGVAGTVTLPGALPEVLTFDGTLYFWDSPPTQAAAQERLRRMAAWLTGGRQRLVFDYEPMRYYMASVSKGLDWSYSGWIDGGLDVSFEAQPYAYAVRETTASASTTGTGATVTLTLDTGEDAPLGAILQNMGTAPITGVTISVNDRRVELSGMALKQGESLHIGMEPPIGAAFSDGESALPYAQRFDFLTARKGMQTITAALAYGSGTMSAKIIVSARGRWL